MDKHSIVPDVMDHLPTKILQVNYGPLEVNQGNELTPAQVKDAPQVSWEAEFNTFYTLCMIDPDAPTRQEPKFREILHWLVVNILGSDLSTGTVLAEYRGSRPPKDTGLHRYIFLLYKQPEKLNCDEQPISKDSREGRVCFTVRKFAKKYSLGQPIAANLYQAQYDDYVAQFYK